jgi:hypothetical protein
MPLRVREKIQKLPRFIKENIMELSEIKNFIEAKKEKLKDFRGSL